MNNFSFLLKTAYRDSRKNRTKLFMFMSSIILGIMALVAINSFSHNLEKDIDVQTKSLLGADIEASGKSPMSASLTAILDSVPGERASQQEFFSMAYIPKTDGTQFVRIKAIEGRFPFYGNLVTEPIDAANNYQKDNTALVASDLMFEYGLNVGDSIRLGKESLEIGGQLKSGIGSISLGSSFAPTVYIAHTSVEATGLIQPGSMVDYSYFIKTPDYFDREEWDNNRARMQPFREADFRVSNRSI